MALRNGNYTSICKALIFKKKSLTSLKIESLNFTSQQCFPSGEVECKQQ